MVRSITNAEEFHEIIKNGKPVFVDFFATWCGPCKAIAPTFEKLSKNFPDATFIKVDIDELPDITEEYEIRAMPTFAAFFEGKKVGVSVGADPSRLEELIEKTLAV